MIHQFMEVTLTSITQYLTRIATRFSRPSRLRFFLPGVLLLFFFNQFASAAVIGKVVQPFASYAFTADDNLLRIRDKMDPLPLLGTRNLFDMSHRFTGGLMFEKEISRQRLTANLNWTHTSFEKFNQLDNDLKSMNGNWNWFLGNRLEGNMGASYVQSLAPFLFQPGVKNIRTEQTEFINAIWRFHPSWSLNGGYTHYDLSNDSPSNVFRFLNRIENRFEGGVDYLTSGRNTVGVLFRNILGDFTANVPTPDGSFADTSYDQKEVLAKINWVVSAKSNLNGTGGWVDRKNASYQGRDFSGFNARMVYRWQPTSKIGLSVSGWRESAAMQQLTARFSLNTGVSVAPSWNITEKVRLEGNFFYQTMKFDRLSNLTDESFVVGTNNTLRNSSIKLTYTPYLGLQLSASIYNNYLKSDSSLGGFNANGANVNLQYIYGKR